jgi:formate/nitrite transporter FocA (FNT family)
MALPDLPWRRLVTSLGYSVGFLMVVLGRQQLFTENTLTVVLPLMARPAFAVLARTARMWSIVLAANLTGTFFAAAFCAFTPVLTPEIRAAMIEVSRNAVLMAGPLETGFHGITAGFLIAAMVWMIPSGKGGEFWIIVAMTYLIGIGNYAHIVAGSMEAFMLMLSGVAPPGAVAVSYLLPALAGNIIGGTALFAVISYAQVMEEI